MTNTAVLNLQSIHTLTTMELAFVSAYIANGGNGTLACKEAGYKSKSENGYAKQASALLRREHVNKEISERLQRIEDRKIASATEVLQFYTSVMRGEVLDQFGIEASLDTRIKAANELAKHQIEIPMKLEQKQSNNNIGSIQLNFVPRISQENTQTQEISQENE